MVGAAVRGGGIVSAERSWFCAMLAGYGWIMMCVIYLAYGVVHRG